MQDELFWIITQTTLNILQNHTTHQLQYNMKKLLNFDELSVTKIIHIIEPIKNSIILSKCKITEEIYIY